MFGSSFRTTARNRAQARALLRYRNEERRARRAASELRASEGAIHVLYRTLVRRPFQVAARARSRRAGARPLADGRRPSEARRLSRPREANVGEPAGDAPEPKPVVLSEEPEAGLEPAPCHLQGGGWWVKKWPFCRYDAYCRISPTGSPTVTVALHGPHARTWRQALTRVESVISVIRLAGRWAKSTSRQTSGASTTRAAAACAAS